MSIKQRVQEYFNTHENTRELMRAIRNLGHALYQHDNNWLHLHDEPYLAFLRMIENELAEALGVDANNNELIEAVEEFDTRQ